MAKQTYFVTGTDTEVGKTVIACGLLQAANLQGLTTVGLKPIAAGCEYSDSGWRNDDALALQRAASIKLSYEQINPLALRDAVAPHIAAQRQQMQLSAPTLSQHCRQVLSQHEFDLAVIEGAGGWLVPLNTSETLADVAVDMRLDVILVVGIKLGCINHALLTAAAIENSGLKLAGWIANCREQNTFARDDNIRSLSERLSAPCLGVVPHLPDLVSAPEYLNLSLLLK